MPATTTASTSNARASASYRNGNIIEDRIYLGGYELYRRYNAHELDSPVEEIESHHLFEGEQRVLLVDDVVKPDRAHADLTPWSRPARLCRYQYSNHLGSACLELDEQAQIISYEEYHPYGTSAYRVMKSAIEAPPKRYRYTGMERDEESGLSYHRARHCATWLGRWVAADASGISDGVNVYSYVRNNPILLIDLDGRKAGNPGTLLGTESVNGINFASYRAEKGTWVSASLAQQGYDKLHGKEVAYGAYLGLALGTDGKPLSTPDRIKPGDEYSIPIGASNLGTGKFGARLLEPPQEVAPSPEEIAAADPKSAGMFAVPTSSREAREALLANVRPDFALWAKTTLTTTVSNFLINLHLESNAEAELKAGGLIFPGQSAAERGTVLQNASPLNAFRHAFGQALITREYGRALAVVSGYAHEDLPTIDTTKRSFSDPSTPSNALFEADTVADQLNNEIGRRIAEGLGAGPSNRDIAAAVLSEFRDKGLYVATVQGPGVVTLSRQRLAEPEYKQWLLKSLNERGRLEIPTLGH